MDLAPAAAFPPIRAFPIFFRPRRRTLSSDRQAYRPYCRPFLSHRQAYRPRRRFSHSTVYPKPPWTIPVPAVLCAIENLPPVQHLQAVVRNPVPVLSACLARSAPARHPARDYPRRDAACVSTSTSSPFRINSGRLRRLLPKRRLESRGIHCISDRIYNGKPYRYIPSSPKRYRVIIH